MTILQRISRNAMWESTTKLKDEPLLFLKVQLIRKRCCSTRRWNTGCAHACRCTHTWRHLYQRVNSGDIKACEVSAQQTWGVLWWTSGGILWGSFGTFFRRSPSESQDCKKYLLNKDAKVKFYDMLEGLELHSASLSGCLVLSGTDGLTYLDDPKVVDGFKPLHRYSPQAI